MPLGLVALNAYAPDPADGDRSVATPTAPRERRLRADPQVAPGR
jgi:hypothetical protein